jgi:hypothetical protein
MTQGVNDLINAIAQGDSTSIDAAFNAEMATRISSRLEDMRVQVAQSMFSNPVAEDTERQEEVAEVEEEQPTEDAPVEDVAELGGVSEEENV